MVYRNLFFVLDIIRFTLLLIRRNIASPTRVTLGCGPRRRAWSRSTHFEPPDNPTEEVDIEVELTEKELLGVEPLLDPADALGVALGVEGADVFCSTLLLSPITLSFQTCGNVTRWHMNYSDFPSWTARHSAAFCRMSNSAAASACRYLDTDSEVRLGQYRCYFSSCIAFATWNLHPCPAGGADLDRPAFGNRASDGSR